jgi:hypothetical protein
VYLEVLLYLYQQSPTNCNNNSNHQQNYAFINKFGNNQLQGDVGTLGNLTVSDKKQMVVYIEGDAFFRNEYMSNTCLMLSRHVSLLLPFVFKDGSQTRWS